MRLSAACLSALAILGMAVAPPPSSAPSSDAPGTFGSKKEMVRDLVSKLGAPCWEQCVGEGGLNGKECHGVCMRQKMKRIRHFLKAQGKRRRKHVRRQTKTSAQEEARREDVARVKQAAEFFAPSFAKNKPSTRFPKGLVDVFGSVLPSEFSIRSDVFAEAHELYCDGVGTKVGPWIGPTVAAAEASHLCQMCGGDKLLVWTASEHRKLPAVSANERRFLQSAPFRTEEGKAYAAAVLSLLSSMQNRTMAMSWSADGDLACVGYSEAPPSAAAALNALRIDTRPAVCGLNNNVALQDKAVTVVQISQAEATVALTHADSRRPERAVTVGWNGGDVTPVPFVEIENALCEVQASSRHPATLYVNGSLRLGRETLVPALASLPLDSELSHEGWIQAALPRHTPVADVLRAFGCDAPGLSGAQMGRCEVSAEDVDKTQGDAAERARRARVRQSLRDLGVDSMSLDGAAIEATFQLGQQGRNGRVLWKAAGVPSILERGTDVTILASFARSSSLSNTFDMHNVVAFCFARVWQDVTLRSIAWTFASLVLTSHLDTLGLRNLCLIHANRPTDLAVMPQMHSIAAFAPGGVSVQAEMPLDSSDGWLGSLSQRIARILGGTSLLHLLGTFGADALRMSAHPPDLRLGGHHGSYNGGGEAGLRGSGAEMISPEMVVEADANKVTMEFRGKVLIPITEGETLLFRGRVLVDARSQTLSLEAGTSRPLYDAFGIPNLHLSYGTIRQSINGLSQTRFIMQAQVALGVRCSPYSLSLRPKGGSGRSADCITGSGVLALNPAAPVQDMLSASLTLPAVDQILAFCGLDAADVSPVLRVVSSWQWRGVQTATFALVQHNWWNDWGSAGNRGRASLMTVPEGFSASGTLKVMGEWVAALLVSSREDEAFKLTAVLPEMRWPGLRLTGMAPVSASGDVWGGVGPSVKLGGVQVGGVARIVLQGYADLLGVSQWFAAEVTDKGVDLRVSGRVHGGVEMSVRARATARAALLLREAIWEVKGWAADSSIKALTVRIHAEAISLCAQGGVHCDHKTAAIVRRSGWFHLCSLTTSATLKHGQLGYGVPDWHRATVALDVWVSGRAMSLQIRAVDLSDWTRAARALAKAIVSHAVYSGRWQAVSSQCVRGARGPQGGIFALPGKCDTLPATELPSPALLQVAVERDNAVVAEREEVPALWTLREATIARERHRAAVEAYKHQKAAWESDEVVRRAVSGYGAPRKEYGRTKPPYIRHPAGAPSDSYVQYLGMTAPLGGQRVAWRLHSITKKLDALKVKMQRQAAAAIARRIESERAHLMTRWPMSSQQEVAVLRAKYRHALAVAGRARRLANEPRQDGRSHSHTGTGV